MQIERKYTVGFDSEWDITAVRNAVRSARRAVLVAHTNADGDAVGAMTGMYQLLRQVGVASVTPLLPDGVPDELAWVPCANAVVDGETCADSCCEAIGAADLIIGLDISGFSRTGRLEPWLRESPARKLLVDHHEQPERESFDTVVSEPSASSTCELVYWLMREAFGNEVFTSSVAESLYTGICTDTGTLSYSNERQSVYLAIAELLQYGVDPMRVNRSIKNVFSEERLRFFGYAMAHRLTVYEGPQVALMVLTAHDMSEAGVESSELTGLINEVMKLKTIDCGILVREETTCAGSKVRLSMRSKERYDVNRLAAEMFGGGGHKRAAGATSNVSLERTVKIVKTKLNLEDL